MGDVIPDGIQRIKVLAKGDQIAADLDRFKPVLNRLCVLDPAEWDQQDKLCAKWLLTAMRAHITLTDALLEDYKRKVEDGLNA